MTKPNFLSLTTYQEYPPSKMIKNSASFLEKMKHRRTVRTFSSKPVPEEIIKNCLLVGGSAPNGANLQPWHFVVVSNSDIKNQIHETAEKEEYEFYHNRAPKEWLEALTPLGTDEHKPFVKEAPYLIVIFSQLYRVLPNGKKAKNYYVNQSVGIATGMLITAIHNAGLVSLTYTPSPMKFLNRICKRPENEHPFLILVVGHPADHTVVPDIAKKNLSEIASFI